MDIKSRLILFLESKGVTKYKFYKDVGLSNGFLDGGGSIQTNKCEKIAAYYSDLNIDWLITGRGSMKNIGKAYEIDGSQYSVVNEPTVPLINFGSIAGSGASKFTITEDDIQANYVVPDFHNIQFMHRVQGNSMSPKFNAGDIIACRILKNPSFIQWNKVHIIATKHQGDLVKRLNKGDTKKTYKCISDNPEYDPFEIRQDECQGIALVIGLIRLE